MQHIFYSVFGTMIHMMCMCLWPHDDGYGSGRVLHIQFCWPEYDATRKVWVSLKCTNVNIKTATKRKVNAIMQSDDGRDETATELPNGI